MKGKHKAKEQIVHELAEMRQLIDKLKKSESENEAMVQKLKEIEAKYSALFDRSLYCVYIHDFKGNFLEANDTALNLLGYTREEIPFLNFSSVLAEDQIEKAFRILTETKRTGSLKSPVEFKLRKKNGGYVWIEVEGSVIYQYGKPYAIQGIARDITERKRVEEALQESETKFRRLTEAAFGGIAVTEKGKFIDVSEQFAVLFGYQQSELIGIYAADLIAPEVRDETMEKILSGYDKPYESFCLRKDGSTFPVEVCGKNFYSQGRELRVTAIRDITERKLTEEILRENREMYKTLTENSLTGIFIHQDERFIFVNDRFAEMHGYKTEELLGKDHLTLIHPDERETLKDIASKRLRGETVPQRYEVRRIRKNGETIWCEMMATRIYYRGRPAIMGNIIDITERKNAEIALKEREEELEIKTNNLEEVNIALKVLLKRRDEDKTELEEKILLNIKELVTPYVGKLKVSGLDEKQNTYVSIIESNLNDIISPFSQRLSSKFLNLTPTEIQVANLLRQGKKNKEISELLHSSPRTVAFHREKIRKKLGLTNKKTNLKSYLLLLT